MNSYSLAKTTPLCRWTIIKRVMIHRWPIDQVAQAAAVTVRTVYKWLRRFREEGFLGLFNRSSRPHHSPRRLPQAQVDAITTERHRKLVAVDIAQVLQLARSTVCLWLKRLGLARLKDLEPQPEVVRYEAEAPGDLLHFDVKKLRGFKQPGRKNLDEGEYRWRGAPRQYLHICIDDNSRLAFARILDRENAKACIGFMGDALDFFERHGVLAKRIMTDNASAYRGKAMARAVKALDLKHIFTRVRRPQTNGKAERFIRTSMHCWGYQRFENSAERDAALQPWMDRYNYLRPHSALGGKPPISRIISCEQCP